MGQPNRSEEQSKDTRRTEEHARRNAQQSEMLRALFERRRAREGSTSTSQTADRADDRSDDRAEHE